MIVWDKTDLLINEPIIEWPKGLDNVISKRKTVVLVVVMNTQSYQQAAAYQGAGYRCAKDRIGG